MDTWTVEEDTAVVPAVEEQQVQESDAPKQKSVNASELSIPQLKQLGQRVHAESQQLNAAVGSLKTAGTNYVGSKMAVSDWKAAKEMNDLDIMVPYTNLLFVRGKIDVEAPMLVELGAGVLMEKTDDQAIEFFEKRLNMVSGSLNKVGSQLQQKQFAKMAIGKEIETKMKNMQLYNKIYS
ncbi:unnamed protein product [Oikopleura dioica]|uniref:Prefoldin subunit 5 n=1 Tax=Oikopleura dioica TaxID=34765 RepID=E4XJU3_OIKDI|nr:unnamed protein product [Oikopleura dioica]